MDKAAKAAILRVFGILSFLQVVKVDVWGKTSQVVSSAAKEQLTSGHISPFNDGQGFFAQFDPSKVRDCDSPMYDAYYDYELTISKLKCG